MSERTDYPADPPGLSNAYLFALFNALSFQVVLSTPMVLYAKTLHASATVLGVITGMMPLLVILQIPAASYISRVGYKKFVYAGWGTRVTFIFVMATVPLTGFLLNEASRLALILALLFGFNLSRGISSCAWLPWISSLVPAAVRGRYLARDAACMNLASSLSFLLSAMCLGSQPEFWQFAALFCFSGVTGAISLAFLKRIPEGPPIDEPAGGSGAVPWGAMIRYRPFLKLVRMIVGWSIAYGGITAFTVVYLKSAAGMPVSQILFATSVSYLGGLSSLGLLGSRLDGFGSKPILTMSFAMWMLLLSGWTAMAGGLWTPRLWNVLGLQFLMGLFAALVTTSNTRLAMILIPVMGRTHFFALYSVIGSVTLGIAPIVWGVLLDALGNLRGHWLGLTWTPYTIFFAAVAAATAVALLMARRLDEPQAAGLEVLLRDLLIQSPQRVLVRLWPRE